jgi:hypothetical protein
LSPPLLLSNDNFKKLEANFLKALKAVSFPGLTEHDKVTINRKTLTPYLNINGSESRVMGFYEAGSGGKKILFKTCFTLALHVTAAEENLPIPHLLVIDSPMKNITPDINQSAFRKFYQYLYSCMREQLSDWQVIIIDQTFCPPSVEDEESNVPQYTLPTFNRKMMHNDAEYPPLISYYSGH